eukprot:scaffold3884_cov392-Prasinococcus_capsulatus_cf.AAC.15
MCLGWSVSCVHNRVVDESTAPLLWSDPQLSAHWAGVLRSLCMSPVPPSSRWGSTHQYPRCPERPRRPVWAPGLLVGHGPDQRPGWRHRCPVGAPWDPAPSATLRTEWREQSAGERSGVSRATVHRDTPQHAATAVRRSVHCSGEVGFQHEPRPGPPRGSHTATQPSNTATASRAGYPGPQSSTETRCRLGAPLSDSSPSPTAKRTIHRWWLHGCGKPAGPPRGEPVAGSALPRPSGWAAPRAKAQSGSTRSGPRSWE